MDYMHFYDVCEKMEVFAASKEEAEYYYAYTDRMREEAEHRLGGRIAQTDQIIRAQRLLKLMAQDAPQILIDNESRLLAQAMVVGRFATKMKVKRVD